MYGMVADCRVAVNHFLKMWKSLTLKSLYRSALAGRPGLAGRVLAGWGWPAWAGWVVVRFGRLAGWFVGLSAGYLVCGLACSSKAVEHVSCG